MHVNQALEAWYVLCSERTCILITLKYNEQIWNKLWAIIQSCFDKLTPCRPKSVPQYKKEICDIIHKYLDDESEFIMEVPKVRGLLRDDLSLCTIL